VGQVRDIAIRRATVDDEASILAIDERVASDPERQRFIVDTVRGDQCPVARRGGEGLGYAIWNRSFFGSPFIWLLFVRADHRRHGIGSALVQQVIRLHASEKLSTSTNESNDAMHHLLAALGFVRTGSVDSLDEGDPEIFYVRRPAPATSSVRGHQ
jgi:GNAT superfamily N-acetyltransferase